ncbi:hypothetical protein C8J57DRAFT_1042429 [Mycena rebaudengoi]|nr:hypothetical protein C8J57DRAFT_1042429 [Mycena rebaudengoi]
MRRNAVVGSPKRRWTLAMALTDEGISDEMLVEKLEAMRTRSVASSVVSSGGSDDGYDMDDWDVLWGPGDNNANSAHSDGHLGSQDGLHGGLTVLPLGSMPSLPTTQLSSYSTETWHNARRALLTCRELVRTERHYLSALRGLLAGRTLTTPPPLMLRYAGELERESAGLLRRMEDDPSAWGVAAAFLGAEEGVESAFVAWCGVVGGWFTPERGRRQSRRLSKIRAVSEERGEERSARPDASPAKPISWRKSLRGTPTASPTASPTIPPSPLASTTFLARRKEREKEKERGKGQPPVRDLAILPTQRIMRYVLLYRDLLQHTPISSPSRALVERAVEAALRIATKCDRAQGNAAFLQRR